MLRNPLETARLIYRRMMNVELFTIYFVGIFTIFNLIFRYSLESETDPDALFHGRPVNQHQNTMGGVRIGAKSTLKLKIFQVFKASSHRSRCFLLTLSACTLNVSVKKLKNKVRMFSLHCSCLRVRHYRIIQSSINVMDSKSKSKVINL